MPVVSILLLSASLSGAQRVRAVLNHARHTIVSQATVAQIAIVADDHDDSALASIQKLRKGQPHLPVILVTSHGSEKLAVAAFAAGVSGYVSDPWLPSDLLDLLHESPSKPDDPPLAGPGLIGNSGSMSELRRYLRRVSATDCNVLILGETGTGKELVAESVHANSPRRDKPFVCLNSTAIPDSLVESELFGHEKGAFTGASSAHAGKLAGANQGTVFFDEIGDIGISIQAKLLRAIESRQIYRLGSNRTVDLDIRVVAATNQNLEKAIGENRFRRDLYYRLNVVRVDLPALRDRREDIPLLLNHFFEYFNRRWNRKLAGLAPRALDVLMSYSWPGNIRELRNVVEALFASLSPEVAGTVDMPPQVIRHLSVAAAAPTQSERDRMLQALVSTHWNKSKACEQLSWSRMTLYRKMRKHRLPLASES